MAKDKYKAIITNLSELDSSGRINVRFDAFKDDELLYANLEVETLASGVEDTVRDRLGSLKQEVEAADSLSVGSEITL
jgi:hypothetical protein